MVQAEARAMRVPALCNKKLFLQHTCVHSTMNMRTGRPGLGEYIINYTSSQMYEEYTTCSIRSPHM